MEALRLLLEGFAQAATPTNLLWVMVGVTAGTFVGVLPGLGASATVAILLPVVITLEPATALITLAGVYYGSKYGGSTTSILVNIPGENAAVPTTFDGYPMAKKGRAGAALAMAAIASFIAGTVGVLGLTFLAPLVATFSIELGPPEYFGLIALGLATVVLLTGDSVLRGAISTFVGLLLATVGVDLVSGAPRFTAGQIGLLDGISFIALTIGLFGIGEVLDGVEEPRRGQMFPVPNRLRELFPTRRDMKESRFAIAQGSVLGFFIGALPGAGTTVASFISYGVQKRFSKRADQMGKGAIEGVAAPEAANNSGTAGALVPLLTLGIPGSGTTAVMLGALILLGLDPGPLLFTNNPDVVWPLIASLYIGNVALVVLNLPLVPLYANLLRTPYHFLYPSIILVCIVGAYSVNQSLFSVYILLAFSLLGYLMRKVRVPVAPLVLAFVLGELGENAFRQSLVLSQGSLEIFIDRKIALVFLVLAAALVLSPLASRRTRALKTASLEEED